MNQKGLREDVKVVINSLLVPHAKGLTLDRLMKEYKEYEMKPFPFRWVIKFCKVHNFFYNVGVIFSSRQLGYNSPQAFLSSIPDVVKCTTLASGHLLFQGIFKFKSFSCIHWSLDFCHLQLHQTRMCLTFRNLSKARKIHKIIALKSSISSFGNSLCSTDITFLLQFSVLIDVLDQEIFQWN